MIEFGTMRLRSAGSEIAPDGSAVRKLLSLPRGSMARFDLAAGGTSRAVAHRTVDEIWVFVSGRGQMWRRQGNREEVVDVEAGVCVTIPCGTHFQFRSTGVDALVAIGVTMPSWPGDDEALTVPGKW